MSASWRFSEDFLSGRARLCEGVRNLCTGGLRTLLGADIHNGEQGSVAGVQLQEDRRLHRS